ncbi:MAG: lipid A-modifier LpxR family protein [Bacteroidota bacterium]
MRKILLIIFCLIYTLTNAQEDKYKQIQKLDSAIYSNKQPNIKKILKETKNLFRKEIKKEAKSEVETKSAKLYDILGLNDPSINQDTLLCFLEIIHKYETIYQLYSTLKSEIDDIEIDIFTGNPNQNKVYLGGLKRNLKLVENHMKHILKYEYNQYAYINTSNQKLKGIYLYLDNDLLGSSNLDMNYTGGVRIEVTTDYLKMRLLPFINKDNILAYQGVFYGMEAYTPFIRDTSIFKTNSSFDVDDRPFASFAYIGRSKYRLHYKGNMRMRSDFKIGIIGGSISNEFQSIAHRDQFVSSVKPYGWDSQIANGGRFAWNIDYYFDLMLFSGKGDIFKKRRTKVPSWLNFPLNAEFHIGNELTAIGAGIGYSTADLKGRSGNEDVNLGIKKKFRFVISANARYRYIKHNSMLEGIGVFETFEDDDDPLAPKDIYRLNKDEVERHLFFAEVFLGLRVMKVTVFYKYTFHTIEYDKPKALDNYSWGRLGINFLL